MIEYDFDTVYTLPSEALLVVALEEHVVTSTRYVNILAGSKITENYPIYKQLNLSARWSELVFLNQTDSQEAIDIQAVWDWVKVIRAESNRVNSLILSASTTQSVNTLVEDFKLYLTTI